MTQSVYTINNSTYLIDGFDLNMSKRTGTYVLLHKNKTDFSIIETGPSLSVPHIKSGLSELKLNLADLRKIIVTHIHLDHSGGAGLLHKDCPQADVIVHPKGKRHLADPSRLVQGAKAVYGDAFHDLFDPVVPVPEEKLQTADDNEELSLDGERKLKVLHTPGHANHHISLFDITTRTMYTGDTAGIRYADLEERGVSLFLPSTSPNQFDPEAMKTSIQRIKAYSPVQIAFGHFGVSDKIDEIDSQVTEWLAVFTEEGLSAYESGLSAEALADRLYRKVSAFLEEHDVSDEHSQAGIIKLDLKICAQGIIDYYTKKHN